MVNIETSAHIESFRRFLIYSTCRSFMPESYFFDEEVFPEKESEDKGSIYIEAVDKDTLKQERDITFINARDVLGVIYVSKSGNTKLKWRQLNNLMGKVTGEASANSLVNLVEARVLSIDYLNELTKGPLAPAGSKSTESEGEEIAQDNPILSSPGAESD